MLIATWKFQDNSVCVRNKRDKTIQTRLPVLKEFSHPSWSPSLCFIPSYNHHPNALVFPAAAAALLIFFFPRTSKSPVWQSQKSHAYPLQQSMELSSPPLFYPNPCLKPSFVVLHTGRLAFQMPFTSLYTYTPVPVMTVNPDSINYMCSTLLICSSCKASFWIWNTQ